MATRRSAGRALQGFSDGTAAASPVAHSPHAGSVPPRDHGSAASRAASAARSGAEADVAGAADLAADEASSADLRAGEPASGPVEAGLRQAGDRRTGQHQSARAAGKTGTLPGLPEGSPEPDISPSFTTSEVCRAVGSRVRELRLSLGLTMSAFAEASGLSLGMLSKIEHGQSAPSLATLVRLAATAQVPVTALFRGLDEEHDLVIVRAGEGHEIHHEGGGPGRLYQDLGTLRGPNRVIEPMITTITAAGGVFPLYQHPGVEFIHMLEGTLDYGYGGKQYRLHPGDTMQIHGEVGHGPVELIDLPVRFISIKVYPAAD